MADYMLTDTYWPKTNEYWPGVDGNDYWPNFGIVISGHDIVRFVLNIKMVDQFILPIVRRIGTDLGIKRLIDTESEL